MDASQIYVYFSLISRNEYASLKSQHIYTAWNTGQENKKWGYEAAGNCSAERVRNNSFPFTHPLRCGDWLNPFISEDFSEIF
jgi:hypothetical protein